MYVSGYTLRFTRPNTSDAGPHALAGANLNDALMSAAVLYAERPRDDDPTGFIVVAPDGEVVYRFPLGLNT